MDAGEKGMPGRHAGQSRETFGEVISDCLRRYRNKYLSFTGGENVREGQVAFAFLGLEIARGDETAEPAIGGAIGRIGQRLESVDRHQAGADKKLYPAVFRFVIGAHHAGKRVAVGDADGGQLQFIGGRHHFLRMRGAAQEGKVCRHGQFGIRTHLSSHTKNSRKQTLHEPARGNRLALVETFAVEPETVTVRVLDEVIVARRLR